MDQQHRLTTLNIAIAFAILTAMIVLQGCATSAKTSFTDADGTNFTAVAKAGPFGQLDTTNQHLAYKWNATDGSIQVGNEAEGLDNSGQVAALQVSMGAVTDLLKTIAPLIAAQQALPNPGGGGNSPDLLDRYERLCLLLCRIAPDQADQFCGCN